MSEKSYFLYGASVQGIQDFIFRTNNLEEIIGASRLVEKVCTTMFADKIEKNVHELKQDANAIVNAAGNIKYIFSDYDSCQKVVRDFPKLVETMAPGITISQAVVKMTGEYEDFSNAVDELERRLHIQRNRPMNHTSPRFMSVARSSETNLPAIKYANGKLYDAASVQRINAYRSNNESARNPDDTDFDTIIHADGNAMGALFSRFGNDQSKLKKFSSGLDELVKKCVEEAKTDTINANYRNGEHINVIICSGDDLTVMCESRYALPFVKNYLKSLEKQSKSLLDKIFGENRPYPYITACAGIAFLGAKKSFRDGYRIANMLCEHAKNDSFQHRQGKVQPSCLLFYKQAGVLVGNLESSYYQAMHPAKGHSFQFGPYYLKDTKNRWTIDRFLQFSSDSNNEIGIRNNLFDWVNWMNDDIDRSELQRKHIAGFRGTQKFSESTSPEFRGKAYYYVGFDLMTYLTVLSNKKKRNK